MKKWITVGVLTVAWILIVYPLASVYRETRRERVLTAFSVELHGGDNFIQLRLPQGEYLCVLSGSTDEMSRGIGMVSPIPTAATIVASGDNIRLEQNFEKSSLKFHISDDTYQPVNMNCNIPSNEARRPLFLNIGGVF
jgi:hypothetical protein